MSTIKVARIITRLNVGGPAYQATLLNHRLPERGYDCLLIHGSVSTGETAFDRLLEQYPGQTEFCPSLQRKLSPPADAKALLHLIKILKKIKPDIVHTHTAKAGLLGRLAGKIVGARALVHTYHGHVLEGYFSKPMTQMILHAERTLAHRTNRLITVSDRLTHELTDRFKIAPPDKFTTVELGLPLERFLTLPERGPFRRKWGIPQNAILLGTLGRLVPVKNHHRMLRVFDALVKKIPGRDLRLAIGGTGPLETELKQTAHELGLTGKVHFSGLVDDLPAFYADIDIALLTSDNEGTPVTLLEAQAAGKFVVAPDVGGVGDVLDPRAGRLISPNTVEAYINAIGPIIQHWSEQICPDEIRLATVRRFSPDRLVNDIDELYKNLLQPTGTS